MATLLTAIPERSSSCFCSELEVRSKSCASRGLNMFCRLRSEMIVWHRFCEIIIHLVCLKIRPRQDCLQLIPTLNSPDFGGCFCFFRTCQVCQVGKRENRLGYLSFLCHTYRLATCFLGLSHLFRIAQTNGLLFASKIRKCISFLA
jgi:hypothetical protein